MASESVTSLDMASQVKAPLAINCTILFLVLIVVGMRIWTRVRGVGLGLDDGLVAVATILGILCLGLQGFFSTIGMGYDAVPSSPHYEELITNSNLILKILFGFDMLYVHALAIIKTSVLCFYLRVFAGAPRALRRVIQALLGLVGAWTVAFSLALAFVCHPLPFRWDPTIPGGACGSQTAMYATLIVTNVVMDLVIMMLPMYTIFSLKMRGPEKIGLMACFSLGMAIVVASCVRLTTIFNDKYDITNPTGGALSTNIFLCVFEVLLGILCICLPTLGPMYMRLAMRFLNSSTTSRLRGGNGRGARRLYGYGHSSSASGGSSTPLDAKRHVAARGPQQQPPPPRLRHGALVAALQPPRRGGDDAHGLQPEHGVLLRDDGGQLHRPRGVAAAQRPPDLPAPDPADAAPAGAGAEPVRVRLGAEPDPVPPPQQQRPARQRDERHREALRHDGRLRPRLHLRPLVHLVRLHRRRRRRRQLAALLGPLLRRPRARAPAAAGDRRREHGAPVPAPALAQGAAGQHDAALDVARPQRQRDVGIVPAEEEGAHRDELAHDARLTRVVGARPAPLPRQEALVAAPEREREHEPAVVVVPGGRE
ncbi:hypothetical protein PG995_010724 [Apiospora arundinis]